MIDIVNISNNFDKYKEIMISLLSDYYGENYSSLIIERINNVHFNFSSTPDEDYNFALSHENELDFFLKIYY